MSVYIENASRVKGPFLYFINKRCIPMKLDSDFYRVGTKVIGVEYAAV